MYVIPRLSSSPYDTNSLIQSECPEVFLPGYDNDFRIQATAMIIKGECWGVLTELECQLIVSSPIESLMPLINRTLAGWSDEVSELIENEPNEYEALCEGKYTSIIFAYTKVFNQYYEKQYGIMEDCNKSFSDGNITHIRSLGYGVGVLLRYMMMDRMQAAYILRKEVARKIGFILIDHDDVELDNHQWCGICHKELKESGQAIVKMVICCNQPIESVCLRLKLLANFEGNAKENAPKTCPVCQYALPKTFITKLSQEHKKELAVFRNRKPVYLDHNHARDKVMGPEEFQRISKVRLDIFRTLSARLEPEILRSQNLKLKGARESVPFQHFLCPCDPLHCDNLSQELESAEGHEHFLFMQSMLFVIRTLKSYQLGEPPLSGCSRSYFKNLDALKPAALSPSAPIPLPTAWVPPPESWIPVLTPRALTQYAEQPFVSSVTQVDRFGALGPSPLPWSPNPPPMTWVPPPTTSVRTPTPPTPSNHHGHHTGPCSPADV
ncbi:hypothetical protein EYC80_008998 [Monilinia laxa]|uniref:RING-type domain-containing protein n=1 Tax=Monilinia laxa TaxID=61186 RepID=A0A5N6K227_MONLA|nr:hypothetical protein EYC80_008998 [Monilinia laxa]